MLQSMSSWKLSTKTRCAEKTKRMQGKTGKDRLAFRDTGLTHPSSQVFINLMDTSPADQIAQTCSKNRSKDCVMK